MENVIVNISESPINVVVSVVEAAPQVTVEISSLHGREVEMRANGADIEWRYVGAATWTYLTSVSVDGSASDVTITMSDVTTNNTSVIKHGFAPKLPNDSAKFLDGVGGWSTPAETPPSGLDGEIQFNDEGDWGHSANFTYDLLNDRMVIGENATVLPDNPLALTGDVDSYLQANIQNKNTGISASADYIITADDGDDTTGYADFGLGNSNYESAVWDVVGPHDGYVFVDGGSVAIGTLTPGQKVKFFTSQIDHEAHPEDVVAEFDNTGINAINGATFMKNGVDIVYHNHHIGIEGEPAITDNGNGTFSIGALPAWFFTDASRDEMVYKTLTGGTTLTPTDEVTGYVCADRDTSTYVILTDYINSVDYVRYVPVMIVIKRTGSNTLHYERFELQAHGELESWHRRDFLCGKYKLEKGALLGLACADTTLAITCGGGAVWTVGYRYNIPAISAASRQFQCVYDGAAWIVSPASHTVPVANNAQYQGASSLTTLTDTYWTINYVYRGIEDADHVYTILGVEEYATSALAQASNVLAVLPPLVTSHSEFVGRIIIQKNATTGIIVESAFDTVFSTSTPITDHGSMTGLGDDDHEQYHTDARGDARYIAKNTAITGATHTKITYDADGLVTSGSDATTADIADSSDKRYVTDAQLAVVVDTSGENTGNETEGTIGSLISGATAKSTPIDADNIGFSDSAASNILKKFTFANLKTYLSGFFTNNAGTVTSVAAGDGLTQSGISTVNPTINVVSHTGSAGSIGTLSVGVDALGVNLGATSTTACAGNDARLSDSRPASDVSAWAKAGTKPSYTASEVGLGNVSNAQQLIATGSEFDITYTGPLKLDPSTDHFDVGQLLNIILSTADPSGGSSGDIWIKYIP